MASPKRVKALDIVFSKYIRVRDSQKGYGACCSCSKIVHWKEADAGHFVNRKHKALRWDETNVSLQCRACNRFDEGNMAGYAVYMMNRYGPDHIKKLAAHRFENPGFSDGDLLLMQKHFKHETERMLKQDS